MAETLLADLEDGDENNQDHQDNCYPSSSFSDYSNSDSNSRTANNMYNDDNYNNYNLIHLQIGHLFLIKLGATRTLVNHKSTNLESYVQNQPTFGSFQSLFDFGVDKNESGPLIPNSIILPETPVPTKKLRGRPSDSEKVNASKRACFSSIITGGHIFDDFNLKTKTGLNMQKQVYQIILVCGELNFLQTCLFLFYLTYLK